MHGLWIHRNVRRQKGKDDGSEEYDVMMRVKSSLVTEQLKLSTNKTTTAYFMRINQSFRQILTELERSKSLYI